MLRMSIVKSVVAAFGLTLFGLAAAYGESASSATSRISRFYDVLIETMQQATELGLQGRYGKLAPAISQTYDLAAMSKMAVGPAWSGLTAEQRSQIVSAFTKMTIATYANRFDGFSGERFEVLQAADQPNGDKMIKTQIVKADGKTVALNYLMRKSGAAWKVVDVYLDGAISELASRRAEFSALLNSDGPNALINSLERRGDKLLSGN